MKSSKEKSLKTYDEKGKELTPTPKKIGLHKSSAIRRELASVYRDMRVGSIETQDGTRLAYVLDMIRKAYETEKLEKKVKDIEFILANRKQKL